MFEFESRNKVRLFSLITYTAEFEHIEKHTYWQCVYKIEHICCTCKMLYPTYEFPVCFVEQLLRAQIILNANCNMELSQFGVKTFRE